MTLPTNIEPGDYLIRHEVCRTSPTVFHCLHHTQIIALHVATTLGGAEFYPSCTQVRIGGSGSGVPSSTVSFPGAYQDTDPGIFDPDVRPKLKFITFSTDQIAFRSSTPVRTTRPSLAHPSRILWLVVPTARLLPRVPRQLRLTLHRLPLHLRHLHLFSLPQLRPHLLLVHATRSVCLSVARRGPQAGFEVSLARRTIE